MSHATGIHTYLNLKFSANMRTSAHQALTPSFPLIGCFHFIVFASSDWNCL